MKYLRPEGSGVFNTLDFILHRLIYNRPIGAYVPIWVNIAHMGLGVNQESVCIDRRPDQIGARTTAMECARAGTTFILGREYDPTGGSYERSDFTYHRQRFGDPAYFRSGWHRIH
jgi:hypothetical protein